MSKVTEPMGGRQERSVWFSINRFSSTPSADRWYVLGTSNTPGRCRWISCGFSPRVLLPCSSHAPPVSPPLPPHLSCLLFQELVPRSVGKFGAWEVLRCDSFPKSAYLNRAPYGVLPACPVFLTTTPCANTRLLNDFISG